MGAHNDTTNDYLSFANGTQNPVAPASGGTFNLGGRDRCIFTVGAGTFKLPDDTPKGVTVKVYATDSATITTEASVTMASLTAGQIGEFTARTPTTWNAVTHSTTSASQSGFIPLPLTGWREISSNDIINATGNGGVLATDTTPTLETVNGDTDGQLRVLWAGGNADALACQVTLPPDLDRTQPITVNFRGTMDDSNDLPVMDIDSFFDEGDTKVEDATGVWSPSVSTRTATIAAADIPDTAVTMSIEITPGAHTTDAMALYAVWLTYSKQ